MKLRNAKRWAPGGVLPCAAAIIAVATASGLRYGLQPILQHHLPFATFTIAALLTEFFVGLWPAMLVTATGLAVGTYFFVPPLNSFGMPEPGDTIFILGYLSVTLLGLLLIEALQRSKYEARLLGEVAQSRLEMLGRSNAGRSHAEAQARHHEERFQDLASNLPHVWYMRRLDGKFEYVNDEFYRCTGLSPGSLEGNGLWSAMHPDDVEPARIASDHAVETGKVTFSPIRLRMADGSYSCFEGQLSCIEDKRGKVIRWIGVTAEPEIHEARRDRSRKAAQK